MLSNPLLRKNLFRAVPKLTGYQSWKMTGPKPGPKQDCWLKAGCMCTDITGMFQRGGWDGWGDCNKDFPLLLNICTRVEHVTFLDLTLNLTPFAGSFVHLSFLTLDQSLCLSISLFVHLCHLEVVCNVQDSWQDLAKDLLHLPKLEKLTIIPNIRCTALDFEQLVSYMPLLHCLIITIPEDTSECLECSE
jgi:hypothetical protein